MEDYILNNPDETVFEEKIVQYLTNSPLYNTRKSAQFDITNLCDTDMLQRFIEEGQPDVWLRLNKRFGNKAMDTVIKEYNRQVDNNGMLSTLRKGFTLQGIKIKLVQFKPDQQRNVEMVELYEKNIFSIVRQMRYSTAASDRKNELDLVILINGIPIVSCELKCESKGQTVANGMEQYCSDRDMNNRMLRSCLVHFVIDENRVMMTAWLRNKETKFLPFNIDTNNPIVDNDYATCYMWNEILQADSLLNILQDFIKQYIPIDSKKKTRVTIFPRYHQLMCVRRIIADSKDKGCGQSYLIYHSAGSGKSKSIAWLAHQLSDLYDNADQNIFDSVIVVTDRIVLDRAIADEIEDFSTTAGVVKAVRSGSSKLADALEKGHRIIITTIQKFANVRKHLGELNGQRFAVIIDEAHSSQNGENAKDVKISLTDKELLQTIIENNDAQIENDTDRLLSEIQASRQKMSHISYFAFTATPKEQTFALFGQDGNAFDTYSMRQAIEEGFILDVLDNYVTFKSMFEIIGKPTEDGDKTEYEKKKARRLIMQHISDHPYVLSYKAEMMLDHFMTKSIHKIKKSAKAMIVTSSRANAVRYKIIIDKLIKDKYNDEISTLVAFSGSVEINEHTYTEENMNGFGIKDAFIRDEFTNDKCKILIVANKFQTGFDQPLLHTMYVDKELGGVQAIQTLSRLNRSAEGKNNTLVVDFVNEQKDIEGAFQPYYQNTRLKNAVDTQKLYDFKSQIDKHKVFSDEQLTKAIDIIVDKSQKPEALSPLFRSIVEDRIEPMEKDIQATFRKLIDRYVRQYTFLSQLMTFIDVELEKYYLFCKMLYKFLPYTKDTLPLDILNRINLEKFRIDESGNGKILLNKEDGELKSGESGRIAPQKPGTLGTLQELLKEVNEPYVGFLQENDKLMYALLLDVLQDSEVVEAFNAQNTADVLIELVKEKFNSKSYEKMQEYWNLMEVMSNNKSFSEAFFRKAFEFLAGATIKENRPEYNEDTLKQRMYDALLSEFNELAGVSYRDLKEVLDWLFKIFNTTTIDGLDGLNEIVKDTFNNLYRAENRDIDLQLYFQTLVTKYEAFLRKIFFMREGKEFESNKINTGLVSVVQQFPAIQMLYKTNEPKYKNLSTYYNLLYQWRNDQAHQAPILNSQELPPALHSIAAMYVYAAMVNATDIEIAEV